MKKYIGKISDIFKEQSFRKYFIIGIFSKVEVGTTNTSYNELKDLFNFNIDKRTEALLIRSTGNFKMRVELHRISKEVQGFDKLLVTTNRFEVDLKTQKVYLM